jgi:hypothetical protein
VGEEIEFYSDFFYCTEFIEYLRDIFSLFYSYFGVEGEFFREKVDAEDEENEKYPVSEFRSLFCGHE